MRALTIDAHGGLEQLRYRDDLPEPADGALVLLLHGFPESRHSWRAALPALARAGYRAVAPDQRGYSPGALPDPADLSNYAFDRLLNDAVEIVAAAGHDGRRFHLVGHDWGGQVSWGVAAAHPKKLASLTTQFSQNLLGDEEEDVLVIESRDGLAGLSEAQIAGAAAEAERRGKPGVWMITNSRSAMEPFLATSSVRALREKGWRMWTSRGDNGNARDNNAIAAEILKLRAKKAKLLG